MKVEKLKETFIIGKKNTWWRFCIRHLIFVCFFFLSEHFLSNFGIKTDMHRNIRLWKASSTIFSYYEISHKPQIRYLIDFFFAKATEKFRVNVRHGMIKSYHHCSFQINSLGCTAFFESIFACIHQSEWMELRWNCSNQSLPKTMCKLGISPLVFCCFLFWTYYEKLH